MFSVVIPTTGRATLDEAVASAEAQGDVEVIVERDPDRTGSGATRNRAIARATRPYIALLDDDDLYLPGRLDRIAEHVAPDRVVTTNAWVRREGRPDVEWYPHFVSDVFPADNVGQRIEILRRNFVFGQGVFAHAAWQRIGGFAEDVAQAEDYDLWLRMIYIGARVALLREPLSLYRIHGGNKTMDHRSAFRAVQAVVTRAPVVTRDERRARRQRLWSVRYQRAGAAVSALSPR